MRFTKQNHRELWDQILPDVSNMLKGFDERPEDIYHGLSSGLLHLFTCDDGFIVVQEQTQTLTGIKELFVWFCQGHNPRKSLLEDYEPDIKELARMIGATKIVFASTRPGFDRLLPAGWKKRSSIYETGV